MARKQRYIQETDGEQFRLTLTEMGHQGVALGRHDDQVVFVPYALPGEVVDVAVTRRYKDYLEARVLSVVEPSPHRIVAPCPLYGDCGGCQWQHIDYGYQLQLKREVVLQQLRRIGKFTDPPVAESLASPSQWHYRNHARFTVNKEGLLGFVRPGTHRTVPIDECRLLAPWINQTLAQLRGHSAETRQVAIRYGINTGDYLIQPRLKNAEVALETGQPSYVEALHGHRFRVQSPSFFQVNTAQAEHLVEVVRAYLAAGPDDVVVDAYAGVGTFTILLAPNAGRTIGVEESPSSVRDAAANAAGMPNVEFVQGKVEDVLPQLGVRPQGVILDPPRAGCHPNVLHALCEFRPRRVVYVSCDPATLARDLRILCDGGFTLQQVQPIDMFPQTYHVECVALLTGEEVRK